MSEQNNSKPSILTYGMNCNSFEQLIEAKTSVVVERLNRFSRVYLSDCRVVVLPDALLDRFQASSQLMELNAQEFSRQINVQF